MPRARLTACIIAENEERRLPKALESLAFCDEIVLVDGGSSDRTVELARAAGAKVIENPWPGFAAQRNVALAAATGDWLLEIDADERVSPELRACIERLLSNGPAPANVAVFALRNRFLGGLLGPSAKYPAYRTRLFRRGAYAHDESRQVHEGIEPHERPIVLEGDLEHELADTLTEALRDAWRYAKLESAHIAPTRDPRAYVVGIVVRPAAKLVYRLVLDGGWRDGWRGTLKVLLDAGSDALVWALVLIGASHRTLAATAEPSDANIGHFGRRPTGPPKVIAIARHGRAEPLARRWLGELAAAGVDVALVSDETAGDMELPGQYVRRLGPVQVMRAIDVEMQIRTAHAVVAFGPQAKLIKRLLPVALRPRIAGVETDVEPTDAVERLQAAVIS
ncbi:MAG TPA: glycosyltransferase family 2 protein [Solirubrobacteraceae bacterium]